MAGGSSAIAGGWDGDVPVDSNKVIHDDDGGGTAVPMGSAAGVAVMIGAAGTAGEDIEVMLRSFPKSAVSRKLLWTAGLGPV